MSSLPSSRFRTVSFTLPRASGSTPVDANEPASFSVRAPAGVASIDTPTTASTASTMVSVFFMALLLLGNPPPIRGRRALTISSETSATDVPDLRADNPATYAAEPVRAVREIPHAAGRNALRHAERRGVGHLTQ